MLALTALLSLVAFVSADQTFSLTAKGGLIDFPVNVNNNQLVLNTGSSATFTLEEPAGYISTSGGYITITPDQGLVLKDKSDASNSLGVVDGTLRVGNAGATGSTSFYACPNGDLYTIFTFECDNGTLVELYTGTGGSSESTSAETSTESTSEAPVSSLTEASTTTAEPVTSETSAESSSTAVPDVTTTFVAGAAQAKVAAGVIAAAGAFLL